MHRAVLFDFGGVIVSGPFESFNSYERDHGLPNNFIRSINGVNPHTNAWAKLERSEITSHEFDKLFAMESASLGHRISGADVLALLAGEIRLDMVYALDALKSSGYKTACLTNNVLRTQSVALTKREEMLRDVLTRFDAVIESSVIGVRKPEPRFYEIACEMIKVKPNECVFLDDLGINLKPAAAMGMATIKVTNSAQALEELVQILGFEIRSPS